MRQLVAQETLSQRARLYPHDVYVTRTMLPGTDIIVAAGGSDHADHDYSVGRERDTHVSFDVPNALLHRSYHVFTRQEGSVLKRPQSDRARQWQLDSPGPGVAGLHEVVEQTGGDPVCGP